MEIYTGGNPLNRKGDSTPIYTEPLSMPTGHIWNNFPQIKKSLIPDFIQNLYYLTMEENGFSYFYPSIESGINLCRYEWHYDFCGEQYFLRIGLCFEVKNSTISNVKYYIQTHKSYEDKNAHQEKLTLTKQEHSKVIKSIKGKINQALERVNTTPDQYFNSVHYIELSNPVSDIIILKDEFTLLPSQIINGKIISSLIVPIYGFSYLSCKRFSDERANIFCALAALIIDRVKLTNFNDFPFLTDIPHHDENNLLKNTEKFYPNGTSDLSGGPNYIETEKIKMVISIYKCFLKVKRKSDKVNLINIIFTYYSACEAININKTLALVSYISCLEAINKALYPDDVIKEKGYRATIVHHILKTIPTTSNMDEIDKWSDRMYGKHRSSFVHGASIKFETYAQNMDGNNFAGLPKALPVRHKPVRKQYEYENDLKILIELTKRLLIDYIERVSSSRIYNSSLSENFDFTVKSIPEAYIGQVNNGWHRIV